MAVNQRDLSILNHWRYLDKASKTYGYDIFTTDVIGMLKFVNAFKYNYTKPFKYRFEFYNDYFNLIIDYSNDLYIKIKFVLVELQHKYRWYVTSSLKSKSSDGYYTHSTRYYTKQYIHTVIDMIDSDISSLTEIVHSASNLTKLLRRP